MKKLFSAMSALLFFFACALHAGAQEQVFAGYNFAVTPPENWSAITNQLPQSETFMVIFGAPDKTRLLLCMVDSHNKPEGPMDDAFVTAFDRGVEGSGGGKRVSGRFIEMDGIKAYERTANPVIKGRPASIVLHTVLTDGRVYTLQGMRFDGEASEDPGIEKGLASFRFLVPPKLPVRGFSAGSAAFQTGYMIGKFGAFGVIAAGVITVILLVIFRNRKSSPPKPPPLPPLR